MGLITLKSTHSQSAYWLLRYRTLGGEKEREMGLNFIHLHLHTEYSIYDGLLTIPALIEKALAFRMPAIAITDLNNLYATVKFYQAAITAGIKPILGADLYIAHDKKTNEPYRFTFLCQTNQGYQS